MKLLVVEPSAASIAHIYYSSPTEIRKYNKYFMTLDIGGGTTDVSILRCTGLHCEVLGIAGNSSLGGIDFDNVIIDILKEKIMNKYNFYTIPKYVNDIIISSAEEIKVSLSTQEKYIKFIRNPYNINDEVLEVIITKNEFEKHPKTLKLIESIINLTKKAMIDDNPLSTKIGNEHLTNIKAVKFI